MTKANQMPPRDRLNELVDHIMQIHNGDQHIKTEAKENSTSKGNAKKHGTYRAAEHTCICRKHRYNVTE